MQGEVGHRSVLESSQPQPDEQHQQTTQIAKIVNIPKEDEAARQEDRGQTKETSAGGGDGRVRMRHVNKRQHRKVMQEKVACEGG